MLASDLFKLLDCEVPRNLALKKDFVGFMGPGLPEKIDVKNVLVVLDYHQKLEDEAWDLIVAHHPPMITPEIPIYVIHSNWDVVKGGANDALAESLDINVIDCLDKNTGIGRICSTKTTIETFLEKVSHALNTEQLKVVRNNCDVLEKVAVVSGFGLNQDYIELAHKMGMDLILSGDLTHKGALTAMKLGISVVDATHHATEVPGLLRLCKLISDFGLMVEFEYPQTPWEIYG